MSESESKFVKHIPCDACGSEDNRALYDDGHEFCFGCEDWMGSGKLQEDIEEKQASERFSKNLISVSFRSFPKRGLNEKSCRKMNYGSAQYQGRPVQVAEYFDSKGALVAQKLRFADKSFLWLGKPKQAGLFGQQAWRSGGRFLVITEGEIDAISMSQLQGDRYPVVSIKNGSGGAVKDIQASLEFVESFDTVVLMFDQDNAGREAAIKVAEILTPGKVKIATFEHKDVHEILLNGNPKEATDAFWHAKPYRPDGIVEGEDLWEMVEDCTPEPSVRFPWPDVQARTLGWRFGEVIVLGAGTSVGKSTAIKELAYHVMSQDYKVGIMALEESTSKTLRGLLGIHLNKPLSSHPDLVTSKELRVAFDALVPRLSFYDHWGSTDSLSLLAKMRYMIRGLGCQFIVLDHISIVVSGNASGDERKTIDALMTALTSLAQETGAGILVVSHLSKPRDSSGDSFEEGREVSLSDFRGSAAIAQLGFTVIALERDLQGGAVTRNRTLVRVLKCRETGDTGPSDTLQYHPNTGRLLAAEVLEKPEVSATPDEMVACDFA